MLLKSRVRKELCVQKTRTNVQAPIKVMLEGAHASWIVRNEPDNTASSICPTNDRVAMTTKAHGLASHTRNIL